MTMLTGIEKPQTETEPRMTRDPWSRRLAIGLPVLVIVLVLVVANQIGGVLIAKDLRDDYEALLARAQDAAATPADSGEAGDGAAETTASPPAQRPEVTVAVSLTEFAVSPDVEEIPAWARVTLEISNDGQVPHDLKVGDQASPLLDAGETHELTVDAPGSGELVLRCTVPGHEPAGMRTAIPIAGGGDAGADASASAAQGDAATPDNAAAYEGPQPPLQRRDPAAPTRPNGTVHELTLTVEEKAMQVAEDVWQQVWTFDGTVPGPTLRVKVGDTVRLRLRNPETSALGHSIDLHASQVAWNDEMRTIEPGEELVYEFTATHAGVFMYHCGTAPTLHHIGNGMYGAIIVEPATPLPAVDHEFVFVQGEYYLGPQGQPGDLDKMSAGAAAPDLVVFNGVANQYADKPIAVGVDESIRAWVLNAGPSVDSSFHIVGTIFSTVVKEGVALRPDNPGRWGGQALDLAPAQGGYVEFRLAEDGLYPIVTHGFNNVGRGALGLFKAGEGGPQAGDERDEAARTPEDS